MPMLSALILYIENSREPHFNFKADMRVSYCSIFFYHPAFALMVSRWLEAKIMQYMTSLGAKCDVIRAWNRLIRHMINKLLYRYGLSAEPFSPRQSLGPLPPRPWAERPYPYNN